jgi:4-carboxymuconolactone decarboxylase
MASELFNKGIALRREVLGAEYVDQSMQNIDDFSMAMQEYATETAWGMIWSRPGLPRKTRSLLNIGLLAAFNRQHEFKLHVKR